MSQLRKILGIPHHVIPVAYLCIGYPVEYLGEPLLQTAGWRDRLPLSNCCTTTVGKAPEHRRIGPIFNEL